MATPASIAGALSRVGKFALVNLCAGGAFVFPFFPSPPIEMSRRVTWEEQDVTTGTKPLFYFNKEPKRIEIREVWLDKTDTNQSIKPEIDRLLALQEESCEGTPPPLLAVWGDYQERVVLEFIQIEQTFHAPAGFPIRARLSLTLKELQRGAR